jgi:hypothetical protein
MILMPTPLFDQYLCLLDRVEDLSIQQLISQLAVERFNVAILPGAAGLDVERFHPQVRQPVPDLSGSEF